MSVVLDQEGSAPPHHVDDLDPVAHFEHGGGVLAAGDNLKIKLHRDPFASSEVQGFKQGGNRGVLGHVVRLAVEHDGDHERNDTLRKKLELISKRGKTGYKSAEISPPRIRNGSKLTHPTPQSDLLSQAMTAYRQGRFDEAESLLTRHLELVGGDAVAVRWMIRLLTRQGRGGEALPYIRQLRSTLDQDGGEHTVSTSPGPREEGTLRQRLQEGLGHRFRTWDPGHLDDVVDTVLQVLGSEATAAAPVPATPSSGRKQRLLHQISRLERAAEALAQRREGGAP